MVSPQHTPPPLDRQQVSRQRGLWWLTMLALLGWNVMAFWPTGYPEVTIPYTTFLAQVRTNNVARVHMVGDSITGRFVQPFSWPPVVPAPSASGAAAPQAPSTAPPPTGKATAPVAYTAFRTTFPEAIGDP